MDAMTIEQVKDGMKLEGGLDAAIKWLHEKHPQANEDCPVGGWAIPLPKCGNCFEDFAFLGIDPYCVMHG